MAFKSLFYCLIPGMKRKTQVECERKTVTERRRENMKRINRLRVSRRYNVKRDRILGKISFDFSRVVVVWSHGSDVPRQAVIDQLYSYGEMTFIQDRWVVAEGGKRLWRGALVEFTRRVDAEKAAFDLPSRVRSIKSTLLETVLNTLADCELLHPECRETTSRVVIHRQIPLRVEEVDVLHRKFHTYGSLATFSITNGPKTLGAVCELSYAYLTQAYLAVIMTDGLMFSGGVLRSVFQKTQKDREILRDAKDCIVFLSQCCFPS